MEGAWSGMLDTFEIHVMPWKLEQVFGDRNHSVHPDWKIRPQRGRGGGVAQKRTNADKGGGGVVDKVDVRNKKKLFSII